MKQEFAIIEGDNFTDLESFYAEIGRVLTKDIDFITGYNLDAFNDFLCGDFGVFRYNETLKFVYQVSTLNKPV